MLVDLNDPAVTLVGKNALSNWPTPLPI